jgi:hypothetical protein
MIPSVMLSTLIMEISVSYVNPTTTVRSMLVMNLMMMIIHEVEEEELEVLLLFSLSISLSIFALVVSCCLELIYISLSAV